MSKSEFDILAESFKVACLRAANWKSNYTGAAYITRIRAAFDDVEQAYVDVSNAYLKENSK